MYRGEPPSEYWDKSWSATLGKHQQKPAAIRLPSRADVSSMLRHSLLRQAVFLSNHGVVGGSPGVPESDANANVVAKARSTQMVDLSLPYGMLVNMAEPLPPDFIAPLARLCFAPSARALPD
jgi:hypothetical protein